jgi:hypothetical protein
MCHHVVRVNAAVYSLCETQTTATETEAVQPNCIPLLVLVSSYAL